jgi:uncharacterized protein YcbK (DUF882 family)
MTERRRFLAQALRLASAGLGGAAAASCGSSGTPAQVRTSDATRPAPAAVPATIAQAPVENEAALTPPPDLFDANLLGPDFWTQTREINWVRPQNGETLRVVYWQNGQITAGSYERICHLLRDVEANRQISIDPKLIETLWACQAFCARYGMRHPLQILSGYRTASTNNKLVEQGLSAAHKSLHLDGRAADVRIVDLNTEVLGALVQSFARGGVGFYPRAGEIGGWIHADTGLNRAWRG